MAHLQKEAAASPFAVANGDPLGAVERRMLEQGKKEHRETTAATKRALQVAEQAAEMASATLVEVQRQGAQLDKTEEGLAVIDKDVREASRVVRFMQRWCCCQIFDCCDPDAAVTATRKRRVSERRQDRNSYEEVRLAQQDAKKASVARLATKGDAAHNGNEAAARAELFSARMRKKTQSQSSLGYGVPGADREELQAESQVQEETLDRIGTTVSTLQILSLELQGELAAQAPQLDALTDKTLSAQDDLSALAKTARKI